jgi:hypothetical protein
MIIALYHQTKTLGIGRFELKSLVGLYDNKRVSPYENIKLIKKHAFNWKNYD